MPQPFDHQTFVANLDPKNMTRSLTIGGELIEVPADAQISLTPHGPFLRLQWATVEHRELQLAGESRVKSTDRIYNDRGELLSEFKSDTGWAVSGAPRLDLIPEDIKSTKKVKLH